MITFRQYINSGSVILEKSGYFSQHLSHLEDLAIENGKNGFQSFMAHVNGIANKIKGFESEHEINAKIDGSPAILFGMDPKTETFFIALKYVIDVETDTIKPTAKLLHSAEEVNTYLRDRPEFATKMISLLENLKGAYDNSGNIYQGDVLYAEPSDKKRIKIGNEEYIAFEPNVIMYAVPMDEKSEIFNRVLNTNVGVIVHDVFKPKLIKDTIQLIPTGKKIDSLLASSSNSKAFIKGSNYGTISFDVNNQLFDQINNLVVTISDNINKITDEFDKEYISPEKGSPSGQLLALLQQYLNKQLDLEDSGFFNTKKPYNFKQLFDGYKKYVAEKMGKGIETLAPKGQAARQQRIAATAAYLDKNMVNFNHLLAATYNMLKVKNAIYELLSQLDSKLTKHTFYKLPDGSYVKTKDEGFVLFLGNNQVKIVDRVDFTKMNRALGGRHSR
jgi:hypothetical protein